MHLRAATLAMVVCGMMIGTLAAQYAQQGHDHAQSSASSAQHNAAGQQDQRRRFSLWDALTGGRNSRNAPRSRRESPPPAYQGNRSQSQSQGPQSQPPEHQTPVSQFGPPQNRGVRRPLGANAQQNEPTTEPQRRAEVRQTVRPDYDPRQHADHDHGYPQPQQNYQREEERPGFMYPLLDFLGNRHRAPSNVPPHQQSQHAPRANTAFQGNHSQPSRRERTGLRALIPDAIANGRPGPLPMNASNGDTGEPQLADPAPQPRMAEVPPSNQPHVTRAPRNQTSRQRSPQPRVVQSPRVDTTPIAAEPQLPPNMASAEIRSPRLGASDAELGILPPPAQDNPSTSSSLADDSESPTFAKQPLVRVKPQRQENAAIKSLAESYRQRNAAAAAPKSYDDWLKRGKSLAIEEKFVEAVDAYTKAIELDPYGLEAYGNRGLAYRERKMYREAVYDFNIVLRMKPELAKAYYDRAETYRMADKLEKAARDYEEAIRLKPDFALAHAQYGAMLMGNGEYEDAVEILDAAIALDDSDKLSVYDRGLAKALRGDFEAALHDFESLEDPKLDGSSWETMLTRLRRPGEPTTTVDTAPAVESLAQSQPNKQIDDLSQDPFFSSNGVTHSPNVASTPANARQQPTVAPSQVAAKPTTPPRRFPQSTGSQLAEDRVARNPIAQSQPSQTTSDPAELQTQPVQQDIEPKDKPMRIVLGGGSTKLDRDRTSFVRIEERSAADAQDARVTQQPEIQSSEPTPIASQPVEHPPSSTDAMPLEQSSGHVLDDDSLWTSSDRNMAASRAAKRGDGSLFKIITQQEGRDSIEDVDPFAFTASRQSNAGVGSTIRPSQETKVPEKNEPTQVAASQPKTANDAKPAVEQLQFDGVALPNPEALATMSEIDAAINQYNEAILRRPRFAPYYEARARLWLKQERRTAALTDLRQAVRLDGSLTAAKTAKEKLEQEIAADLARQQELLRTANRSGTSRRRSPRH